MRGTKLAQKITLTHVTKPFISSVADNVAVQAVANTTSLMVFAKHHWIQMEGRDLLYSFSRRNSSSLPSTFTQKAPHISKENPHNVPNGPNSKSERIRIFQFLLGANPSHALETWRYPQDNRWMSMEQSSLREAEY